MNTLEHLLNKNKDWANIVTKEDPGFFDRLSQSQSPEYLWIGCADSRVPPNTLMDLAPGELFVHRNIANMVVHTDLSCLSVIQYAVEVLKVKHIIVCGHYGCGGVKASLGDGDNGLIDNWLGHIKNVYRLHKNELDTLSDDEQFNRLCELNVTEQVRNVCNTNAVKNSWASGQALSVHGWIYNLNDGLLSNVIGEPICE